MKFYTIYSNFVHVDNLNVYIKINKPSSTKCNVNHRRKMTYTRTKSRIFWKHVL